MASTLFLGLGGTGSRVVNKVARELKRNRISINDGIVSCAVLDTDMNTYAFHAEQSLCQGSG